MSAAAPQDPVPPVPLPASLPAPPVAEQKSVRGFGAHLVPLVRPLILSLLGVILGAALTYFGLPAKQVEVITEVFRDTAQPLTAPAAPIDYEGLPYHGDHHADHDHGPQAIQAQAARWPTDRITYSVDYTSARGLNPPLSDEAIRAALRQATGWWADNLQLEFVEVPAGAQALIPIRFERIDGPANVLAEAYLANGTLDPKPLRFDSAERWTPGAPAANLVSLPTVACHELGHSLGLSHDSPSAPAVMRPSYTAAIPREQERDVSRMVALGYKRREKVPPAATDVLTFPIQARTDDVVEALKKAGFTVSKP
jgi:hypothetical protein